MYPVEPHILTLENALLKRMAGFSISDQYSFIEFGHRGEMEFAKKFPVNEQVLQLFNVCLSDGLNKFEIDRLLITAEAVYAFEIKNYYGNYIQKEYSWEKQDRKLKNPLNQFYLMKQGLEIYLKSLGVIHPLVCKVIFIQPTFSLSNTDCEDLIFYKEIRPLMKQIHEDQPCGAYENNLYQKIKKDHRPIQLYHQRPNFNFEELKQGILCAGCYSEAILSSGKSKYYICPYCLKKDKKTNIIMDSLDELTLLLNRPFTKKEGSLWVSRQNRNIYSKVLTLYYTEKNGRYEKK